MEKMLFTENCEFSIKKDDYERIMLGNECLSRSGVAIFQDSGIRIKLIFSGSSYYIITELSGVTVGKIPVKKVNSDGFIMLMLNPVDCIILKALHYSGRSNSESYQAELCLECTENIYQAVQDVLKNCDPERILKDWLNNPAGCPTEDIRFLVDTFRDSELDKDKIDWNEVIDYFKN